MTEEIRRDIEKIVDLSIETNPLLHQKEASEYMKELLKALSLCEEKIIRESLDLYNERKFWETKNIMYFKGICLSKKNEFERKKLLEDKILTPIPKIKW